MRKSPIRHQVHQYKKRNGTAVSTYMRGQGERKPKVSQPRIHKPDKSSQTSSYLVHITYTNLKPESFPVNAPSYPEAIEMALSVRTHITPPLQIGVTKA